MKKEVNEDMELNKVYDFLDKIARNNNRDWFNAHKAEYDEVRSIFENFVQIMLNRIAVFDPKVMVLEPKECTFRFYRDIRFSKNKMPFKIHMGAYMNPKGRKSDYFGYYVHLEPGKSFIGGGSIGLPTAKLTKIRTYIMEHIEEYVAILEDPVFKSYFPSVGANYLKVAPKGFSKDYKYIDYLRCKEYICSYPVTDEFFYHHECMDELGQIMELVKRYGDFINSALGY